MKTDILQFSNIKNNFVTSMSTTGNLFKFKLEQLSTQIAFYLLGSLSYSSDTFSVRTHIEKYSTQYQGEIFSESQSFEPSDIPNLSDNFWASFSEHLVHIQLHLLGAYFKVCMKPEALRSASMLLDLFDSSLNAYTESHGLSLFDSKPSVFFSKVVLQKSFEMSLYQQNLLFMDFDNSTLSNRPTVLDQLRRHKEKTKLILEDFGKLGQADDVYVRKGTGSVGGSKFSLRKSNFHKPRHGTPSLKIIHEKTESEPSEFESNHHKFLKFIHDYYVNK
jgi:hypothetical protein